MATTDTTFDELERTLSQGTVDEALDAFASRLREEGRHHELFDCRLMQARRKHGLPLIVSTTLDEWPEAIRTRMEDDYLAACREVGRILLDQGRIRDAWVYLRPVGNREEVAAALEKLSPDDHAEEIIEIGLNEGVAPALGFGLLLERYGTCNAITMFDAELGKVSRKQRQQMATMLVRHLHGDLFGSLVADITRQQGAKPRETTIAALVADRDWLFDNDNYHIDTTHLSSVVRFALLVDDPDVLRLALELTAYGERLAPQFRFPGNEPFTDLYPSAALFIEGLLGTKGDEARAWFKERADQTDVNDVGTYPAEVYISLLARTGQISEAIDALARLLPAGTRTGGFAPSLLELAQTGHEYRQLTRVCREQGDLVGYAAGLLSARLEAASQRPA